MKRLISLVTAALVPLLLVAATPAGAAHDHGGLPDWHLVLDDDFDGTGLDTAVWRPGWFGTGLTGPVNGLERQGYDSRNVTESGGALRLALTAERGALVSSNPHDGRASGGFEFTGPALVEARIRTPGNTSAPASVDNWPGFWSDGQRFPADGEIDTMEGLSGQLCFHVHDSAGAPGGCAKLDPGWHVYASYWNPGDKSVTFYYDGYTLAREPFTNGGAPQYLVLDNTSSSTPVPETMLVDWIRVWQWKS
ncbi:glycoside hydrolase family 16 protein [Streptacidiphilus anmyonensis]|uniref:glycoside hydrolase family 16 protein n=1 Tax=Streptacidiphilus anmyonensis TaxID=405782 RepID=UPI0005AB7420|nr:hypothetical protein [Streptacidiphilus anmyonensis]